MFKSGLIGVLVLLLSCGVTKSQQLQLKVAANPPQYLADWENQKQLAVATVTNLLGAVPAIKIGCVIQKGGAVIARTDLKRMPVVRVDRPVLIFYTDDILPASALVFPQPLPDNKLTEGDYELCVAVYDESGQRRIIDPKCQPFSIRSYQQPQLIFPADKAMLLPAQSKTIQFRWTPVSPVPAGIVKYKLQVFEVMSGQYPEQAVRSNQPLLEKELPGATQFIWVPQNDICIPCTYVWTVQALDRDDRPIGRQEGRAAPFTFKIGSAGGTDTPLSGQNISISLVTPKPCYNPGDVVQLQYSGPGYTSGNNYNVTLLKQTSSSSYYQVQLINNAMPYTAGTVSFTLSSTLPPGTYYLHIHGNTNLSCGGYDLSPPIIICDQPIGCSCNKWNNITMNWTLTGADGNNNLAKVTSTISTQELQCGKSYNINCNQKYNLKFSYLCNPDSCKASYNVAIHEPSNNTTQYININPNTFSYTFSSSGQYTMTIYPKCGDKVCDTCVIKFNNNCQDCCKELLKQVNDQKPTIIGSQLNLSSQFITTQPVQTIEATVVSIQSTVKCTAPSSSSTRPLPAVISSGSCIGYGVLIPYQSEIDFAGGSSMTPNPQIHLLLPPPPSGLNCKENIKVCIRYLIQFEDCRTCEVVRCYYIQRSGGISLPDNDKNNN